MRAALDRQAQVSRALALQASVPQAPVAASSSDGATHPPATSIFQESASNPVPAGSAAAE